MQESIASSAQTGEEVDAVGFPVSSEFAVTLQSADLKRNGSSRATVVDAVSVTSKQALEGDYDSKLVRIQGRLLSHVGAGGR